MESLPNPAPEGSLAAALSLEKAGREALGAGMGKILGGAALECHEQDFSTGGIAAMGCREHRAKGSGRKPQIKEQRAVGLQDRGQTHEEIQPTWDCSWC